MTMHLLSVRGLNKSFEGLNALSRVSMNVEKGETMTLVGPNGAGKTTFFNIISGLERGDSGNIYFKGRDISGMAPEKIAEMGISRTFQTNQVFPRLNVIENIMVGRYLKTGVSFFTAGFWLPGVYREEHRNMVKAFEILEFLGLYDKANRKISQVSYMERKLIELGRTLAMEPELLLLDEPFGGLNMKEIKEVSEKIRALKVRGVSIVIIDHHFGMVSEISDRIAVLHHGNIIAEGRPEEIMKNKEVESIYLPVTGV